MVQSPSWEAKWFAASQEIPRISRNLKVHYRTHKRPPPVYILGQPNPVHIPTSHLLEIHPYIIHPSTPRSSQWCPSLRFPHQDPIHPLSAPICATCPDITAHFMIRLMYYELSSVQPSIHPSIHLPNHPPILFLVDDDDSYTRLQVLQISQHAPMLHLALEHHTLPVQSMKLSQVAFCFHSNPLEL